jgi:uncharacterized protein YndB with AHSA1/START domain
MKRILVALAVLVGCVLLCVLIGAMLPQNHVSSRAATYRHSPAEIWRVITDPPGFPAWRNDVKQVEILAPVEGRPSWRETDSHGNGISYEIVESDPPRRLGTRIVGQNLPFGGTWTYELTAESNGGTLLRITENGEIYNPVFRFVARFFLGYTGTQEQYLRALGNKFGETITVDN